MHLTFRREFVLLRPRSNLVPDAHDLSVARHLKDPCFPSGPGRARWLLENLVVQRRTFVFELGRQKPIPNTPIFIGSIGIWKKVC